MQKSTSLDPEETTISRTPGTDYQSWRKRYCDQEWAATSEMYRNAGLTVGKGTWERFKSCRTTAFFVRNIHTSDLRIKSNACRARWCPICSNAKSKYLARVVLDWCTKVKNLKLITFTLKHSNAPLDHQIKHLYRCFRLMRQNKRFSRNVKGGIWFFQVKQAKSDGQWHPHIHAIIESQYISQHWLAKTWLAITGTSKIVDIRAIRTAKFAADYVSRYAVRPAKLATLSLRSSLELLTALHGRRLCGTWGSARCVKLSEKSTIDGKDWEPLGTWSEIIANINKNDIAKSIWKAYCKGEPYHGPAFDVQNCLPGGYPSLIIIDEHGVRAGYWRDGVPTKYPPLNMGPSSTFSTPTAWRESLSA